MLSRMGFHIVSEVMVNLHPDYSERLEHFANKGMILKGDRENPRFREALSIVKYFLDNTFPDTSESERFCRTLQHTMEKYDTQNTDYWEFASKTPLPMQDYLKVTYDLRPERGCESEAGSETARNKEIRKFS